MFTVNTWINALLESGMAETIAPSYDDSDVLVVVGDWNRYSNQCRLDDIERLTGDKYSFRFYDEVILDDKGRAHELHPGFYGQTPTYNILAGDVWARDEIDSESMLEAYAELLEDDTNNADQWGMDFTPLGYKRHDSQCENGFHPGQTDTPEQLWDEIQKVYGPSKVIFTIDETGQFDIRFSAWYKPESVE